MCGIYGIISDKLSEDEIHARLLRMGQMQQHRGPDGQGELIRSGKFGIIGLGLVRLAILDLVTGMQPIRNPADDTAIVCNGQIYNYLELRSEVAGETFVSRGDIEVALHLYRKKGIDFLSDLNGMYAGAIFDPGRNRLLLFRDRFGIKPLYYAKTAEGFAFSSEIKPLYEGLKLKREINPDRLPTYFTYRYVPGSDTLFHGIRRVPPGSYLICDLHTREIQIRRYWEYRVDKEDPKITLREAGEYFYHLFRDAVRIRLRSDVELGSFISGGIDSSAVSSIAARNLPELRLYTISFAEQKYDELPHVQRFLNTHSPVFSRTRLRSAIFTRESLNELPGIIKAVEEPISLGTLLPTDQVCALAARDVKAVLTGEGADEIFAGYRKFMIEAAASGLDRLPKKRQMELLAAYPELFSYLKIRDKDPEKRYIQPDALFTADEIHRLTGRRPSGLLYSSDTPPVLSGKEHPVNAAIAFESRFRLPDYVVLRLDKLSMRHSLETRTPLLDYRLAEFAARLPVQMKVNLSMNHEKLICAYTYLKYDVLDAVTAIRRKQPFTFPMADWLSDSAALPGFIREILSGDEVRRQNILDPVFVKNLAGVVTAENIGPQTLVSAADQMFSIIVFTLWYREFFL